MSYEEMIGLAVKSSYEGRWAIYTFHNINESFLSVSDYDLTGFPKFLKNHGDKIWVAPACEIVEYILEEWVRLGL